MPRNENTNGYNSFEVEDPLTRLELSLLVVSTVLVIIGMGSVILRISGVL